MNLKKRILYYLIGLSLGLVIVVSTLGVRGCDWLPENRIKTAIAKTQIYVSENNLNRINCSNYNNAIFSLLNNGEIDFSKSDTKNKLKTYFISDNKISLKISINLEDTVSKIIAIDGLEKCEDNPGSNVFVPLHMTNSMTLEMLRKNPIKKDSYFNCGTRCFNLDSVFISSILHKGKILFNHSKPKNNPNPIYVIQHSSNSSKFVVLVQQGEKKTRFKKIAFLEDLQEKTITSSFIDSLINLKNLPERCNCND